MRQRRPSVRAVGYTEPEVVKPVRLQATDPELDWHEHSPGRGGPGGAQVIMPPAGPPSQAHLVHQTDVREGRAWLERQLTGDQQPRTVGDELRDLREANASLSRQLLEVRQLVGLEPPAPPPPPPRPKAPPRVLSYEEANEKWLDEQIQCHRLVHGGIGATR